MNTKALILGLIIIIAVPVSLFIGRVKITDTGIEIERPITAILIYLALVMSFIESKEFNS